jgi:PPM family protein phosphatase
MNLLDNFNAMFGLGRSHKSDNPLKFAQVSDIGGRDNNQDYCAHLFTEQGALLLVADGLGGHKGGELASRLFCELMMSTVQQHLNDLCREPEQTLKLLAEQTAAQMSDSLQKDHPGVDAHTTCAVAWVSLPDYLLTTLHVGDSRIYRFNKSKISWRSRDHSVVQMLVDTGEITEDEMGTHPEQGSLTRSIAVGKKIKPSVKTHTESLQENEALLLCSDGFWEMLTNKEIMSLTKSSNLEKALQKWVTKAIKRAGKDSDNVTAQVFVSH